MYIIIIGCGRMGATLATELANEGHDVAIIDRDPERLNIIGTGFNGNRIKGIEYDTDILHLAGIEYASVFLAMTPDDNINIAGAQIARDIYKVPRVIARISDPQKEFIYKKLKLETICPTQSGAAIVKSRILDAGANMIATLDNGLEVLEVVSALHAKRTVGWVESKSECSVSAVIRQGEIHFVQSEDLIQDGDRLLCVVRDRDKSRLVNMVSGGVV